MCVCASVRLCVRIVQSHLVPETERLAPRSCRHGLQRTCFCSRMRGAKFFSFSSNITAHQYLITPGPNHKINSQSRGPAQWHVWLCVNVSALCMNNSLPTSLMRTHTHTPRCSHLPTVPCDTLTNLSIIKPSAFFIKVEESTVSDVLSHW